MCVMLCVIVCVEVCDGLCGGIMCLCDDVYADRCMRV